MRARKMLRTVPLLLAALLPGCGGGGGGGGSEPDEPRPFRVLETRPVEGERFVSQDVLVRAVFSGALDVASLGGGSVRLEGEHGAVSGTLYLQNDDSVLLLDPGVRLDISSTYRLTLAASIASTDGETLGRDRVVSFTTVLQPTPRPPEARDFRPTFGPLNVGRSQQTATRLLDGRVLVAGGFSRASETTATAEIYDPEKFLFELLPERLVNARARHTATLLEDGRVLLAGGLADGGNQALATCEIFDPSTGSFSTTGEMTHARAYHTADRLDDGRVLVCGGAFFDQDGIFTSLASAEIYDPATGRWTELGSTLVLPRSFHESTRLADGRILLTGGASERAAEVLDPESLSFTRSPGDMRQVRGGHTAVRLDNGLVVISGGGAARGEFYDPKTGTFQDTSNSLSLDRTFATATPIRDGGVLVLGGIHFGLTDTILLSSMDLYSQVQDPVGSYFQVIYQLEEPRAGHTATPLLDGSVLICGGINVDYTEPELRSALLFRQD